MANSTAIMSSSVDIGTTERPHVELASHTQFIVISAFYIIICIFGIVGNSMVIAAVALCRKLQTPTNVFVVSLAITDLLSCLTLPFQVAMFLSRDDGTRLPGGLCAFIGAISIICLVGSILTLALIAFNRCFLITQPRKRYAWLYTTRKLFTMTAIAWLYPTIVLVLPQAVGIGKLGYSPSYRACLWDESHSLAFVSDILVAITFLFTFAIILFCYIKIWIYIRRHVRRLRNHSTSKLPPSEPSNLDDLSSTQEPHTDTSAGPSQGHGHAQPAQANGGKVEKKKRTKAVSTREIEITKNLFYVICAFFLCIIPYTITLILPTGPILDLLVLYASIPLVFNGCVNPIIYAYKHPTMKVVFRYLIRCQIGLIPKPSQLLRRAMSLHQHSEGRGEGAIKTVRDGHPSFCSMKKDSFIRQNSNNLSRSVGSVRKESPDRQSSHNN